MLRLEGIRKEWGDAGTATRTLAIDGLDLTVESGEFVCVIGPSGCGKSTLLEIGAGLITPTEGAVFLEGKPMREPHPDVGVVFQEDATFPWLTATQNVEFGLQFTGVRSRSERARRACEALELVGLRGFENHYPGELSGGMRQRVNIARVLASLPKVVLMDEPFGAVDEQTRLMLTGELLRIWAELRLTVMFVTHSLNEAALLSDRIVVMSARPGRVQEIVTNRLPRPRVAAFGSNQFAELTGRLWELLSRGVLPTP